MQSILVQLDTDSLPSVFDRVVAVDAGVDHLFSYGGVSADTVTGLVHGAMFTRGPSELKRTAIFVGGSDVRAGEDVFRRVQRTFFGPMRVSVMMDSNGCNTTAAAAVASAKKHVSLDQVRAIVAGGTGPVGLRAAELLALEGAHVTLVSRTADKAAAACHDVQSRIPGARLQPLAVTNPIEFEQSCRDHELVIAAGAAGVQFLGSEALQRLGHLKVAIDLNAVPPAGIADISVMAKAVETSGTITYGAIGVGGLKMKVHKRAVASLFESNDKVLDTRAIYQLALSVAGLTT